MKLHLSQGEFRARWSDVFCSVKADQYKVTRHTPGLWNWIRLDSKLFVCSDPVENPDPKPKLGSVSNKHPNSIFSYLPLLFFDNLIYRPLDDCKMKI